MALSSIEIALTRHLRHHLERHTSTTLKRFAFFISLSSCLCAGSVLLFPLFTSVLSNDLGLTQFQINVIGSCTSMGMYLPLPILGYLADSHGTVILSVISMLFFSPSYVVASLVMANQWHYSILAITFAFIGCATSALYFTCLLTCAKIYPESKGLTISAPVTAYGLSSLIGSQVLKLKVLRHHNGELNLFVTFRMFAVLYFLLGIFNWASSTVVTIERDVLANKPLENEETRLLEEPGTHYTESETIILEIEESDHKKLYISFLKDGSAYILLFAILLTIGPSEMYITNMGSLIAAVSPKSSVSNQVSIHAIFSTLSRLTLGALSDFLLNKFQISRIVLLVIVLLLGAATQLIIANNIFVYDTFYIISALSGFSYGGLFTLFPTVVLSVWGAAIFGSTWGTFMIAPAIGATEFGMVYALIYDAKCAVLKGAGFDTESNCVSHMFWITGLGFAMAVVLVLMAWQLLWRSRKFLES